MRRSSGRILRDKNAAARKYLVAVSEIIARIVDIDSAAKNAGSRTILVSRRKMCGYINTYGKTADDNKSAFGKLSADL